MPRRKPGTLLPLEKEILRTALSMRGSFHGFGLAHEMREQSGSRALTAHGTLYKALGRLEERGLLTSAWEALPFCVLEAMQASLPVVAYDVGDLRAQVVDGVSGFLVQPFTVDELARRVELLVAGEELGANLGHRVVDRDLAQLLR